VFLCGFLDERLLPGLNRVHEFHHVLSFGGEAGDSFAIDNGLACRRVYNAPVDGGAVAA
jgi:hypothetical protein